MRPTAHLLALLLVVQLAPQGAAQTAVAQHDVAPAPAVGEPSGDEPPPPEARERWSDFLPLMKDVALEHMDEGQELPLPFGINVSFTMLKRDTQVTDIKAAVNGPPKPRNFISIESSSTVFNAMARLDTWVLPFWSVYLLGGYTKSESEVALTVDFEQALPDEIVIEDPGPTQPPIVIPLSGDRRTAYIAFPVENEGPSYGVGTTLAAGYLNYFLSVDVNWTHTNLGGVFDEELEAAVVGVRTGYQTTFQGSPANIWISGTYWDTERDVSGTIPLNDAGDVINFEIVQGPTKPWSVGVGGQATFSREWQAVLQVETNFDDMYAIISSIGYRF